MEIERYFEQSRRVALGSEFERTHVGCIAVYKGKVISTGHNSEKTHPMQMRYNKYRNFGKGATLDKVHAEIKCISRIKDSDIDFKKVKIFVYRVRYDQPYGLARPCKACMKALADLGIKDIYYTTDYGFAHEHVLANE